MLPISEFTDSLSSDSIITQATELSNIPVAVKDAANNWGFILFFICFFIIVSIISNRNKFLLSLFSRLYRNKDRQSMFYETVTNETFNKIFLCIQTVILISIIIYCYAVNNNYLLINSLPEMYLFIGKVSLLLFVFLLYKFLTYSTIGVIFFKKEMVFQWNDDFFSLISLNGIFLFIPTLFFFYVESAYSFWVYFFVFYLILNLIFIFYKVYTLFFNNKQHLLYFILYLCAQEIIPIYLVYSGIVYLITQKETIWM